MGMVQEFKEFAMRGNVVDLAVGIIIGGAFGKIVSSLVADVIMPPLGILMGKMDFSDLALPLQAEVKEAGVVTQQAVTIKYGHFFTETINFIIVAFAVFLLVKGINRLKRKQADAPPAQQPADVQLLTEIRDLLKTRPMPRV